MDVEKAGQSKAAPLAQRRRLFAISICSVDAQIARAQREGQRSAQAFPSQPEDESLHLSASVLRGLKQSTRFEISSPSVLPGQWSQARTRGQRAARRSSF